MNRFLYISIFFIMGQLSSIIPPPKVPTIHPCSKIRILQDMTYQFERIVERIQDNKIHNRDYITASELIKSYNVLYEDLCDDCKDFAKYYTVPQIDSIVMYFGMQL